MTTAVTWHDLQRELDAWADDGRAATFWWRDDDAVAATPELDRLLTISEHHDVPLGLAVIPAGADESLPDRLADTKRVTVLQHGYAHRNYAGKGEKKAELGRHRPTPHVLGELAMGWEHLMALFADRARAVVVPPWNRIAAHLIPMLPEIHYVGLSTLGARARREPVHGLLQVNTHIDIIDWSGTRGFAGDTPVLQAAIEHLSAKRQGAADADEPTGVLTHHLAHDETCWRFLSAFIQAITAHPAGRWQDPAVSFVAAAAS